MRNHNRFAIAVALLSFLALPLVLTRSAGAADKGDDKKGDDAPAASASAGATGGAGATASTDVKFDASDVSETAGKTYYFVGMRYRGTIVPKFMMNLFVDEGATVYSNAFGFELDIRKDAFSLIPALTYVEYGTSDILFLQKGKNAADAGNWSYVNSSLKAIYATVDLLWSTPVHKNFDFEYGFGTGVGVVFGDLQNNWVFMTPTGGRPDFTSSTGVGFTKCPGGTPDGTRPQGCNKLNHQNSTDDKVGSYVEKSWFSGGSVPNLFLHLAIPQIGMRFKPAKQFEARLGLGFSLTGFWFGLSADYGLEQPDKKKNTGSGPTVHFGQH